MFTRDWTLIRCFGTNGHDKGEFSYPGGIAFDFEGTSTSCSSVLVVSRFPLTDLPF